MTCRNVTEPDTVTHTEILVPVIVEGGGGGGGERGISCSVLSLVCARVGLIFIGNPGWGKQLRFAAFYQPDFFSNLPNHGNDRHLNSRGPSRGYA